MRIHCCGYSDARGLVVSCQALILPCLAGTRSKQDPASVHETGKHFCASVFPQNWWCRSSKFSPFHPSTWPDDSPVMAISNWGEHKDLPFEWLTFQPALPTRFLSLPIESVFKLSHKRKMQTPIPSNIACKVVPAHSPEVLLEIRLECGFDLQTPSSMFNQNIPVYAKQQPLAPLGFFSQHLQRKDRTPASLLSIVPWNSPVQEPNLTEDHTLTAALCSHMRYCS